MGRVGTGFVAGACAVLCLPALPGPTTLYAFAATAAAASLLVRRTWILAIGLGALLCAHELERRLADRLDPALEGQVMTLRGTVASVPQGTLQVLRFRLRPEPDPSIVGHLPALVELTWYDAGERVRAGERVEVEVKLRRPRGFANAGGRDNEARMLRDGVGASGYVRSGRRLGRPAGARWREPVLLARGAVDEAIRRELGQRPAAGIVAGLAVGLQDALSREQWLVLARSGTSHLMAISGLHIAMVGALGAWCGAALQRVRQRRGSLVPRRDVAVLAGAVTAFGYSLLAGWSVPTQRTMTMIAVAALALLCRRRVGIADGVALCAAAVVLLAPLAPLAPGFWLSFGAVAAILYGATGHVRAPGTLPAYLHVQGIVTLGLVPVLIGSFGAVSLVAAPVNLYAIPLYTLVVVPAVLLSSAAALTWPALGGPMLRLTAALIEWTWPLIEVPANAALATWAVASLPAAVWLALGAGTLAALSPLPWRGRAAGVALVVCACLWQPRPPAHGEARVTVLDVGQGLAAVVQTRHHALLYDAGPSFRSGSDTGQLVVAPWLRAQGRRQLDAVVVSHDDLDHKGGVPGVLGLMPARRLVLGPSLDAAAWAGAALEFDRCRRGDGWRWDGVTFEWMHPGPGPYRRDNDGSCVLLVRTEGASLLVTGDVEAGAEHEMLEAGAAGPVDLLVAPHHGSRTSSTAPYVAATQPRWVVYPVGHRNRWNFPAPAVVERWEAAGARSLRTSEAGAITFDLTASGLRGPAAWRLDHPRPWRDP
jgi:competence protein ComEC